MTKEFGKNRKGRYVFAIKIYFAVAVATIGLFILVAQFLLPDEREKYQNECREFVAEWQRIMDNGERIPIEFPGKVPAEHNEVVTIVTTIPADVMEGETICFNQVWQDVVIYVDGEIRIDYNTDDSRIFGTNSAQRNLFLGLRGGDAGKELKMCFSSDSKYAGDMRTAYIGDRLSIWMFLVHESGVQTTIAMFMAFMSLFCIIISLVLRVVYKKTLPISYLAWTILLCALWVLSEIDIRQLFIPNLSTFTNLTYWCLMLIPIPLVLYMNEIQDNRHLKLYAVPLGYTSLMLLVGTVVQVLDIAQFVDQLMFVHVGIAFAIITVMVSIAYDVMKGQVKDYFPVAIGAYGLLFTAVLEIVLYYIGTGLTLGTVLLIGLMFLLIMAIIKTGQDMFQSEQKKQQAVAARAAQAKFLANMSHEIRTPINAVVGMNEMILRESDISTIHEYALNIQSASSMLLGLVNDILDFSKIEFGQLELVEDRYNISNLINTEILLLKARANDKAIATRLDIDRNIPAGLYGDELRIKQIVTNVLSNAVKYTQEGSVSFKASFDWIDEEHIMLCFRVADTGVGIREEDLSKLFDSFKRLEQNKNKNIEGTGLGLNIARQLVELMQGSIEVESIYGKGSVFTIKIPQQVTDKTPMGDQDVAAQEEQKSVPESRRFTAPEAKILAVDDNNMNLAVVKGLLKRTQVQLDLASGGKECITLAEKKKYDIIFMDHMMPDMDGIETLQTLRNDPTNPNHKAVVIALTANAVAGCKEMYLEYGFDEYISKPIQIDRLESLMLQFLPKDLIIAQELSESNAGVSTESSDDADRDVSTTDSDLELLVINKQSGLSYAMDSEELYLEILQAFCEQVEDYIPQLEECYRTKNWPAYAVLTHAIKGNARNIGADAFSEFSKKQEYAAKAQDEDKILADYKCYMENLHKLKELAGKMTR